MSQQISATPWASFGQSLMQDFQSQYSGQQSILNLLSSTFQGIIGAGGYGFANNAVNAMRTGATDTISGQYQNAQKALQERQATTQDANLPSGVAAQQNEQLLAAKASADSGAQNQITMANEQARQQSYYGALSGLSGVASMENPLGYAGAANQSGDVSASLVSADAAASKTGFMNSLENGLGSGIGGGLGGGLAGMAGTGMSMIGSGAWGF